MEHHPHYVQARDAQRRNSNRPAREIGELAEIEWSAEALSPVSHASPPAQAALVLAPQRAARYGAGRFDAGQGGSRAHRRSMYLSGIIRAVGVIAAVAPFAFTVGLEAFDILAAMTARSLPDGGIGLG